MQRGLVKVVATCVPDYEVIEQRNQWTGYKKGKILDSFSSVR